MNLSSDQFRLLADGNPVRVSEQGLECVVVRSDVYEQLQMAVAEEWTPDEMRRIAERTFDDADSAGPIPTVYSSRSA